MNFLMFIEFWLKVSRLKKKKDIYVISGLGVIFTV